ncbi:MAG: helix-turn-helix transcriptional regulator [Xanthomonadaceae bacterium]|nr:helix-turn-helix transcriptional regulator [Xanthomonadaceae bacterium]
MPHTTIGERITYARQQRNLSQGELMRQSGIAATQLSRYETGRAIPRKLAAAKLSQALAVSLRWLETGEGQMDEFPSSDKEGMTFWIDDELRSRLASFASYNGLTLTEALAEILDSPLAVYGPETLPTTPEDQEKLRRILRRAGNQRARLGVIAQKVRILS